jgi:hypothetical protein
MIIKGHFSAVPSVTQPPRPWSIPALSAGGRPARGRPARGHGSAPSMQQ